MRLINGLSSDPVQRFPMTLDNGDQVFFTVTYRPAIQMWFITIEYGDFIVHNMRLCKTPNLLSQYENIIPFGLFINVEDNTEPLLINDLQSGRVKVYLLDAEEVQEVEDFYASV